MSPGEFYGVPTHPPPSKSKDSAQQFLFRPRPMEDESLSSWRQRSGMENGFRIYPRKRGEPWRTDPDKVSAETARWLATTHSISAAEVSQLELGDSHVRGPQGPVHQWMVPLRYTKAVFDFGPVACSDCLSADPVPYFRLAWRYAFVTSCPVHDIQMLDRCEGCSGLLWPSTAAMPRLYALRAANLHECARCGFDIRTSRRRKGIGSVARTLMQGIKAGAFRVGESSVPTADYMDGLAFVAQLFVWKPSASRLWPQAAGSNREGEQRRSARPASVERLDVRTRQEVLERSLSIMQRWPDGFFDATSQAQMTWQHISGIGRVPPPWMLGPIRDQLSRQERRITCQAVRQAATRLEDAGLRPSKASVARILGCHEAKAINALFGRRQTATRPELLFFIERLEAESVRQHRRRSSLAVQARDCAMVAYLVLVGAKSSGAEVRTPEQLLRALGTVVQQCEEAKLLVLLAKRCLGLWVDLATVLWGATPQSYFRGVRGEGVPMRALSNLLSRCMTGLDGRLARNPEVFQRWLMPERVAADEGN